MSSETVNTLILDLLEWIGPNPRPCTEVLEAWRTSCPRFPVCEDGNDRGFIARHLAPGRGAVVSVFGAGWSTCGSTANRRRAEGWPA